MAHLLEMILVNNCEEFKFLQSKIEEVLKSNRTVTISWEKTSDDLLKEIFLENQQIQDQSQYTILENLTNKLSSQNPLFVKILLTLLKYDVEQKQYTNFIQNFNKLSCCSTTVENRTQIMEIFKKIKTQIKGIINIEEKFKLIQLLYQENQISKYRLQILYEQMKAQFEENNQIRIWFLEQFATYEKNNFQLISQICDYYLEQSNQEQAYKYLQLIIGQSINDLNFREIEQQYQLVKSEKKIILNQIQEIEQEIKKSQSNDLIQLSRDLIMLKNEIGQPISDLVYNYQQLSSYYRDQKNYKQAISTLQECLDKIKAEQLINYNPELLYFESTSLELLGDCLRQINETQEALNAYIDSIQIKKEIKKLDPRKLILIKKRISGLYYKQKQYQLALETEVQVMQMQQNIPDKQQSKDLGETQFNIAQIYFILDQKQQAQEYCEQAILNLTQSLNEKDKLLKDVKKLQRKVFQNRTSKVLQDYEI